MTSLRLALAQTPHSSHKETVIGRCRESDAWITAAAGSIKPNALSLDEPCARLISEKISHAKMFSRGCQCSTSFRTNFSQSFCVSESLLKSSPEEPAGPPLATFRGLSFQSPS